jgi:hypothetical protein
MRRVLHEMSADPGVPKSTIWRAVSSDLAHGLFRSSWIGLTTGIAVLVIWFVGRSHHPFHVGMYGLWLILFLLFAAGFAGARQSGTFAAGLWTGLVAGLVSGLTVPGDFVVFGIAIGDPMSTTFAVLIAANVVMTIVAIGAIAAHIRVHQRRLRGSFRAFVHAWRQPA